MYICSKVITCSRLDITYITLGTSTGMVANPAGVQLNRDFIFPPFPVRASLDNDNLALARQVQPSRFASACVCCVCVATRIDPPKGGSISQGGINDTCVCVFVCIFIKLHITAQSGPVIYSFYATACNPPGGYLS